MPLKLNIGLARKVGEPNYSSRGASVNVEMELESALIYEPVKLKDRIRQLFDVVRSSVTEELNSHGNNSGNDNGQTRNGDTNGNSNGAGHSPQNGTSQTSARPATSSQVKAILAIAAKQRLDVHLLLQNRFHATRPEQLSIRQASEFIDTLKSSNGG